MSQDRPNLLYIHSDQHNPAVTGCYGDPLVQTPNLDHLAAKGVQFNNCYCPSPICVPSRMSMLSGRYPYENHVWTNRLVARGSEIAATLTEPMSLSRWPTRAAPPRPARRP